MVDLIKKIAYFFHITDDSGQLDLTDLSFMLVVGKIMVSPNVDWPALCALVPVILNKMHRRHVGASESQDDKQSQ